MQCALKYHAIEKCKFIIYLLSVYNTFLLIYFHDFSSFSESYLACVSDSSDINLKSKSNKSAQGWSETS